MKRILISFIFICASSSTYAAEESAFRSRVRYYKIPLQDSNPSAIYIDAIKKFGEDCYLDLNAEEPLHRKSFKTLLSNNLLKGDPFLVGCEKTILPDGTTPVYKLYEAASLLKTLIYASGMGTLCYAKSRHNRQTIQELIFYKLSALSQTVEASHSAFLDETFNEEKIGSLCSFLATSPNQSAVIYQTAIKTSPNPSHPSESHYYLALESRRKSPAFSDDIFKQLIYTGNKALKTKSAFWLADILEDKKYSNNDPARSRVLYENVINQTDSLYYQAEAQCNLALMLYNGSGGLPNKPKARELLSSVIHQKVNPDIWSTASMALAEILSLEFEDLYFNPQNALINTNYDSYILELENLYAQMAAQSENKIVRAQAECYLADVLSHYYPSTSTNEERKTRHSRARSLFKKVIKENTWPISILYARECLEQLKQRPYFIATHGIPRLALARTEGVSRSEYTHLDYVK